MVNLTINGEKICVPEGTTIKEAAEQAGIRIPTLCYFKDLNDIGACRVCCVEVEGERRMVTACNNPVREGMVVWTNSPRARETRRVNVELILSQHDCHCATCVRSQNCKLQEIANDLGIFVNPYEEDLPRGIHAQWTTTFPLYRDAKKCIKCMRCVQVCDKIQSLNIWELTGSGGRATIDVSYNRRIKDADCSLCGQCITHCPVGALRERDDVQRALDALADPDTITVVQIAPGVRTSWGEPLGLIPEMATVERLAAVLRRMGFDYVFDTTFSADLTIMEESAEFLERLKSGALQHNPMFTSCCPGWVRFLRSQYPDMTALLSSAKSPQQMFGAVTKTWFAKKIGVDPKKICCISVMPCLAKKAECDLPTMQNEQYGRDVDLALTTREVSRMIRADNVNLANIPEEPCDSPLGEGSGAGVIFGITGGVMEAALRTAYFSVTGTNPPLDAFIDVRGDKGWREADFDIAGKLIHVAVVSGLGNTRKLIEAVREGRVHYDFVEVMACPGGCTGGGGQPIQDGQELVYQRGKVLYELDERANLRFSHENQAVQTLYKEYLGRPLSELSETLLHTEHGAWPMPGHPHQRKE
nr:[FeFe] hydrogenase, group A [uncultured Butyricicoccus sp.]